MVVETVSPPATSPPPVDDELQSLRRLQRLMLQCVASAPSRDVLLAALCDVLTPLGEIVGAAYMRRNEQGELQTDWRVDSHSATDQRSVQLAELACRSGIVEVRAQASQRTLLVAGPVVFPDRPPEAFVVLFAAPAAPQRLISMVQLAISHIAIWQLLSADRLDRADADQAAAIVELLQTVVSAPSHKHACYAVADALKAFLNCDRVAIGWQLKPHRGCKLAAYSGVGSFDPQSSSAEALEAAMNEAIVQNRMIARSASTKEAANSSLAHKTLQSMLDIDSVVSISLTTDTDVSVGAILLAFEAETPPVEATHFLQAAQRPLATALAMTKQLDGGWLGAMRRTLGSVFGGGRKYAAAAVIAIGLAALFVPAPHHIHGDCKIEPVIRRFVAAPFESTLKHSLVRPGDLVKAGDALAELDDRELGWKRAAVVADRNQAIKQRDAAQVGRKYAEQQIAQLEIERFDLELQLLDHRARHLTITAPIDGVVAAGDLDRAEGAPLTIGQSLFEIAPLESMVVESSIADDDITFAKQGQSITIHLDAYPDDHWQAKMFSIEPRSEVLDERNVFIANADVDNVDGRLRPGMRGKFVIEAGYRPLGWILFHKPWETVVRYLIW